MPADVRFVQFIARRYAGLHGYAAVVLALTLFAAAPLLPRAWTPREWTWLAGIGAAFVAALMATDRYYGRTFGRTRQTTYDKHHTWIIALALFLLDALSRALPGQNIKTGLLALGFGGALAVEAWRDRRFRAHAFLVPAVALYIGVDRLTASGGMDLWVWLQRSVVLLGSAVLIHGIFDHRLIASGLSPENRRLAMSSASSPTAEGLPSIARDPIAALMLTALDACEQADVKFVGHLAGLRELDAASWVAGLRDEELIHIEEHGRHRTQFLELTAKGRDAAGRLWPTGESAVTYQPAL